VSRTGQIILAATLYAFDEDRHALLIRHPRMGIWCPPGGKIAPHELPHEAALRECWEETGYRVQLLPALGRPVGERWGPPPPLAVDAGPANGNHLVQLVYCGVCDHWEGPGEEGIAIRWVSLADLARISLPINVRERYWQFRDLPDGSRGSLAAILGD
jgi:8-oxo-dGTP pyrophosphatase MutT (NUDIX family)